MEDDRSIVLTEVDGILATLNDRHDRLLVDGDEYGVGSGAYVVRVCHGVGVEHAVLVVNVCQLVRFGLAEECGRPVEDSAVLELQSCSVGEVCGTDVLCDVILYRQGKGHNIRFADGRQIRHVQHRGLLEGHVDGRILEARGAGIGLSYRIFQSLGEVVHDNRVGYDRVVDGVAVRGEPLQLQVRRRIVRVVGWLYGDVDCLVRVVLTESRIVGKRVGRGRVDGHVHVEGVHTTVCFALFRQLDRLACGER